MADNFKDRYLDAFGQEVNFMTHVHMRGYDREGKGKAKDASFYDRYGAPIKLENTWMEGYHAIELVLASNFKICSNPHVDFPLVAGIAGGAHLYKPVHEDKPWNWTGWVPQRNVHCQNKSDGSSILYKNRQFLNIRGNEIQNNLWDYHPYQQNDDPVNAYEGGYWLYNDAWGRYLHIIALKIDDEDEGVTKRYNYIVHPFAYRALTNDIPDDSVDAMQWSILNINYRHDGVFTDPNKNWGDRVHGLEIFNDFTYNLSWLARKGIGIHNGTLMNNKYIYWFDTYPLEYAECLLDTSLERGVYMHVLAANDAFYLKDEVPYGGNSDVENINSETQESEAQEEIRRIINSSSRGKMVHEYIIVSPQDPTLHSSTARRRAQEAEQDPKMKSANEFYKSMPYGYDTALGHVAIIDTGECLRQQQIDMDKIHLAPENFPLLHRDSEACESTVMDKLIDGTFYSHTGVYDIFNYKPEPDRLPDRFPFVIAEQPDETKMCYVLGDMDLIFDFPKVKETRKGLIWRYSLEHTKEDATLETVHGYFKMDVKYPTRLNLSKTYDRSRLKWIQFAAFQQDNPQRRAWFNAVRGANFGEPKPNDPSPKRSHRVALTKTEIVHVKLLGSGELYITMNQVIEEERAFQAVPVHSNNKLEFLIPKVDNETEHIFVYDMQVCAHQPEVNERTKHSYRDESGKLILPERYIQNVHGYFKLNERYPTKLNLSSSWDAATVLQDTVYFYGIDTKTGQPTVEHMKLVYSAVLCKKALSAKS